MDDGHAVFKLNVNGYTVECTRGFNVIIKVVGTANTIKGSGTGE